MHNAMYTCKLDDQGKHQIQQTSYNNTATGIRQLFSHGHVCENSGVQICYRSKTAQECEGRTKESRYLQLGAQVEEQSSQTRADQGYLNGKPFSFKIVVDQNRYQNRRTKHCEHMLQT